MYSSFVLVSSFDPSILSSCSFVFHSFLAHDSHTEKHTSGIDQSNLRNRQNVREFAQICEFLCSLCSKYEQSPPTKFIAIQCAKQYLLQTSINSKQRKTRPFICDSKTERIVLVCMMLASKFCEHHPQRVLNCIKLSKDFPHYHHYTFITLEQKILASLTTIDRRFKHFYFMIDPLIASISIRNNDDREKARQTELQPSESSLYRFFCQPEPCLSAYTSIQVAKEEPYHHRRRSKPFADRHLFQYLDKGNKGNSSDSSNDSEETIGDDSSSEIRAWVQQYAKNTLKRMDAGVCSRGGFSSQHKIVRTLDTSHLHKRAKGEKESACRSQIDNALKLSMQVSSRDVRRAVNIISTHISTILVCCGVDSTLLFDAIPHDCIAGAICLASLRILRFLDFDSMSATDTLSTGERVIPEAFVLFAAQLLMLCPSQSNTLFSYSTLPQSSLSSDGSKTKVRRQHPHRSNRYVSHHQLDNVCGESETEFRTQMAELAKSYGISIAWMSPSLAEGTHASSTAHRFTSNRSRDDDTSRSPFDVPKSTYVSSPTNNLHLQLPSASFSPAATPRPSSWYAHSRTPVVPTTPSSTPSPLKNERMNIMAHRVLRLVTLSDEVYTLICNRRMGVN